MLPDTTLDQSIPVRGVAHMDVLAIDDTVWVVTDIETRGLPKVVLSVARADGATTREFTFDASDTVVRYAGDAFIHLARTAAAGTARVAELEKSIETTRRRDEVYMARLVADAHEYANDNNLCERFDDFMESHDLPRRSASYAVTVDVEQRIVVYVTAASEEDAERIAAESDDLYQQVIDDIAANGLDAASYSAERD